MFLAKSVIIILGAFFLGLATNVVAKPKMYVFGDGNNNMKIPFTEAINRKYGSDYNAIFVSGGVTDYKAYTPDIKNGDIGIYLVDGRLRMPHFKPLVEQLGKEGFDYRNLYGVVLTNLTCDSFKNELEGDQKDFTKVHLLLCLGGNVEQVADKVMERIGHVHGHDEEEVLKPHSPSVGSKTSSSETPHSGDTFTVLEAEMLKIEQSLEKVKKAIHHLKQKNTCKH